MDCDMCGKAEAAVRALIEGSTMAVCESCGRYGKILTTLQTQQPGRKTAPAAAASVPAEESEFVVANIGQLLKQKREALGLTQDEFARKIAVKESVLHKMEVGGAAPSIREAMKIGRLLGLRLVEHISTIESGIPAAKSDQLTLGDLIKIKKK